MKNFKYLILGGIGLLGLATIAYAAPVIQYFTNVAPFIDNTYDMGTSTNAWKHVFTYGLKFSTTTGGCLQSSNTGLVFITGTNCGTGSNSFAFPFDVHTGYNSTSTVIGFNGLFSTASSTFGSNLFLTSLAQGNLYTGSNGLVSVVGTSTPTVTSPITYSGTLGQFIGGVSGAFACPTCTIGGLTSYDAFTHPSAGKSATTSEMQITGGLLSTGSTTISNNLFLSSLAQGYGYVGSNGIVKTISTTTIGSDIFATSSNTVYINSERTDTYTANGTILYPYKSITAANSAVVSAGLPDAAYYISPGTYVEQSMTMPSIPLVIHSGEATILVLSGASVGAGSITFPSDLTWYDANVFGNVALTSSSLTNQHTMVNAFVVGNLTYSGLATLLNSTTQDQYTGTYPFLSQSASSTLTANAGSLVNILGSNIVNVLNNKGTLNLVDDNVQTATSTRYAIDSSTGGSVLHISGISLENFSTGGSIDVRNSAPASAPNAMTGITATEGAGSVNGIEMGTAIGYLADYNITTLAGATIYATPNFSPTSGVRPLNQAGLIVEGNALTNVNGGFTGVGTSTPAWSLQVSTTTANTTFKPQFAITDSGAGLNLKHWTVANEQGNLYFSTSTDLYATSSVSALTIQSNGKLKASCYTTDGSTCITSSSGSPGGTGTELQYRGGASTFSAVTNSAYITSGSFLGLGTTTPAWLLQIATTSTAGFRPQLALTDMSGSVNSKHWYESSFAGVFEIGTTSDTTYATSSAISISAPTAASPNTTIGIGGTTTPYATLSVQGVTGQDVAALGTSTAVISLRVDKNGIISFGNYANCNGTTNALGVTSFQVLCDSLVSDQRLKKDIVPLDNGLDTILKLNPVSFYWKDLTNHNTTDPREQYGFLAQDIQPIIPSAVGQSPDGYLTLDKTALISPIVDAIKTLYKDFQTLLAKVTGLENRINEQQKQIDNLQGQINNLKK